MLQRLVDVSAQLQQVQADFAASERRTDELTKQLAAADAKVQGFDKMKTQLTQVTRHLTITHCLLHTA